MKALAPLVTKPRNKHTDRGNYMKQKSKYLFGASMSLLISFAATITPVVDNNGITVAMNVVYFVAIVIAILCTRGYADVARRESRGKLHGKYLTLTAKIFGLDRRYFGWEFDSSLNKRIKRERLIIDRGLYAQGKTPISTRSEVVK